MKEIWKDVEGWEGLYQVSNLGRVKSLPRMRNAIHPYMTNETILSPRAYGKDRGYVSVALCCNGRRKQISIHRLVAKAFVPNPCGYGEVNHIDENKSNNVSTNLEWCSRSYNINYGSRIAKQRRNLLKPVRQFALDGSFVKEHESYADAAKSVNGFSSCISHVVRGDCNSYRGFVWRRP